MRIIPREMEAGSIRAAGSCVGYLDFMSEYSAVIRGFVSGDSDPWAWDDFISTPGKTRSVALLKQFCSDIQRLYPPASGKEYCSERGVEQLLEAAAAVEAGSETFFRWLESNHDQWLRSISGGFP